MHLLVCSHRRSRPSDHTSPVWTYLRSLGHVVTIASPADHVSKPDAIIGMGISVLEETREFQQRFPHVPLFCYCWDAYEWCQKSVGTATPTNPRPINYDYKGYGELLKQAAEVWVPSECTGRRSTQWWGFTNWHVILSACPWWEYEDIRDGGYALCTLREIPDPWWGKFEECCSEIGIPHKMTLHMLSFEDYQREVAHCRFLCAPLYELSTGGLTLMEGYFLGKPCLLSDSEWNGSRDYMGDRARYFRHGDVDDFKSQLMSMFESPPILPPDHKDYITHHFSSDRMAKDMIGRIHACTE